MRGGQGWGGVWADFIQSRPSGLTEKNRDEIRQCESLAEPGSSQSISEARGPGGVLYGWSWPVVGTLFGP